MWALLAAMSMQAGFFARLTWWEYSWDIMEPVTYFATFATMIASLAYYIHTSQVKQTFFRGTSPLLTAVFSAIPLVMYGYFF